MKSSEQIGGGKKRVGDGARARISSRITGLQKTTGAFLFGTSEIIGLASAVVLLLAALFLAPLFLAVLFLAPLFLAPLFLAVLFFAPLFFAPLFLLVPPDFVAISYHFSFFSCCP